MSTGRNPRQAYPFFKAHVFDAVRLAWVDARRETFSSAEDARAFLSERFPNRESRIVIVTERGRQVHEGE